MAATNPENSEKERDACARKPSKEAPARAAIEAIQKRDRELIDAHADYLNRETEDVLRYQAPIEWETEEGRPLRRTVRGRLLS